MNNLLLLTFLIVILFAIYSYRDRSTESLLIEYDEPPFDIDDAGNFHESGYDMAYQSGAIEPFSEDFRVSRTGGRSGGGRPGGGRPGGGRGGGRPGGGGGRPGRGGGMRPGRGGHRPGRHPWRRRHRPWRRHTHWTSYPHSYYPYYSYYYPYTYSWYSEETAAGRFVVKISPKSENNPTLNHGSDKAFSISTTGIDCGVSGARLDLQRNRTYEFDIYTQTDCVTGEPENEPFIFTTDPDGGEDAYSKRVFDVSPTTNGTIRVKIGSTVPAIFYYQSTNNPLVGGKVFIH